MIDRVIGFLWLGKGIKYVISAARYPRAWHRPISEALAKHNISIHHATTLRHVVDPFKSRVNWRPDALFQAADTVKPPIILLDEAGDDCDGSSMLWAQAVNFALKDLGFRARIVSYLSNPWHLSHHVCIVTLPTGELQAIQPPPIEGHDGDPVIDRYFKTYEHAAREVASWYGATVQGFDVRDCYWNVVHKWTWLS